MELLHTVCPLPHMRTGMEVMGGQSLPPPCKVGDRREGPVVSRGFTSTFRLLSLYSGSLFTQFTFLDIGIRLCIIILD